MRREAEVASGLKGPEHRQSGGDQGVLHNETLAARRARPQEDHEIVFQSTPGYIYTVASKRDQIDPATGERIVHRPILAKFDQGGFFRLRRDDENFDLIYRRLTNDKYFGMGRHFWLLAELQEKAQQAEEDALTAQLAANPSLLERVAARLGEKFTPSFEQPKIVPEAAPKPLDPADPTLKEASAPAAAPVQSEAKPVVQAPSPATTK